MNNTMITQIWSQEGLTQLFLELRPLLPTYAHLLVSALFPIYTGAHAALSRPSTAAKPPKRSKERGASLDGIENDDPVIQRMEGMTLGDAILFPILAGVTLTSLYFLIKWLEDPAILNTILNWYFATFSIFSVARLVCDGLDVLHSLAFPRHYLDVGALWTVQTAQHRAVSLSILNPSTLERNTPLPGRLALVPLPAPLLRLAWFLKAAPNRKFTFRLRIRRFVSTELKLGIHGIEGVAIGLVAVLYYNLIAKPWPLTNLMGLSFAYGSLQLLSPTKFTIGTLLLAALFVYDVYMVFYTPMMVNVATKLEIPAKLEFPRPEVKGVSKGGLAMLGLGDVVLPGIFCGLALRFDLWMFYLRKQQSLSNYKPVTGANAKKDDGTGGDEQGVVKASYISATGSWGDRFWTSRVAAFLAGSAAPTSVTSTSSSDPSIATSVSRPYKFPKPYFTATIVGYVLGMLATLLAMQISNHPQPALLYLVPGVVGSVWLTGLVRSELSEMLAFSEEDDEEGKADDAKEESGKREKEPHDKAKKLWDVWGAYLGQALGIKGGAQKTSVLEKVRGGVEESDKQMRNDAGAKNVVQNNTGDRESAEERTVSKPEDTRRPFLKVDLGGLFALEILLPPPSKSQEVKLDEQKKHL